MLPKYPMPTSNLVIAPRLRCLAERPRLLRRCGLFATGALGTRSRRQRARCEHRDGPRADPNGPKRNTRLRNTTRAEPSPYRPAGKIVHLPYCPRHRPLSDGWGNYPSGGQPMIDRFRDIARALVAVLLLGMACASAQTAQSPTSPNPGVASQAGSVPTAPVQPAGPAGPKINTAEITARANRDVGVNIETAIKGWQDELDRLESALQKPRLRYSELNDLRDELQRVRAEIEDFSKRLEPRLAAAKDQVALLGPAPAAGQPPEPEQAALNRAELNYLFGLLSAGQAAAPSANLRIDQLINTIQDIRRKNFATSLFQPVPGIYSYQTWAKLPDYVPSATSRVRDLLVDWWDTVRDQND